MNYGKVFSMAACGLMMLGLAQTSSAEELVLTSTAKGPNNSVAIDVVTSGSAVALQFNITLPKGVKPEQVDLSKCVADLPKTHSGQCNVAKGQIIGLVYNDQNVPLPEGIVSIGRVSLNNLVAKGRQQLAVAYFEVNDASGQVLPTETHISQEK